MPSSSRNSGYSASELSSMQRDAMERVREMQRRARQRIEETNRMVTESPTVPAPHRSMQQPANNNTTTHKPAATSRPAQPAPLQGILDRLNLDGDTVLILILLLLLMNDGSDQSLILALVWLLI